jgi:hypothetical protein
MRKIIDIKFYLFMLFSIVFLSPFVASAQEEVNSNKAVEISVSFLSYHKNYIGIDLYVNDQYIWNYLPGLMINFPYKNLIIRTNIGLNNIYNNISTRSYGVFDYEKSVQGNYFQTDLSLGLEKKYSIKKNSFYYFFDVGLGIAFYSGDYYRSSNGVGSTNEFKTTGFYTIIRPGIGVEIYTFQNFKLFFESSIYIDRLTGSINDTYSLFPKSKLRLEPIGKLGITYVLKPR